MHDVAPCVDHHHQQQGGGGGGGGVLMTYKGYIRLRIHT
tara:strand:- start:291 stop:407 length:117 start_codon:yes stop_codon:yes gene_type:complete